MLTACVLLVVLAVLGAFDIAYFHWHRCGLARRPESRVEVALHVARGVVYALQMALVPNVRFAGAWYAAFVAIFVVDVVIAVADVIVEPESRRSQGGLPGGEYLMHIVLSVLVGAYLHALAVETLPWAHQPTAIVWESGAPLPLRVVLGVMAATCLGVAIVEAFTLLASDRPRPLHVSVRLRTSLPDLWRVTQDHVLHPRWDHRFSRIEMLADHPLSLIRRGVGLWLYRPQGDGTIAFSTSYTYEVRWGVLGRVVDRLVFRPFFQRETERSFQRLAEMFFPDGASPVYGASGRKPARAAA